MQAIILSIGDELVLGQTVDTNSAWLAEQLVRRGISTLYHQTLADDRAMIAEAVRQACRPGRAVLITGGLGPTDDDLTRQALADAMGAELVLDEASVAVIEGFFQRRGRSMPPRNKVQAMHPAGTQIIPNHNGTAPGIRAQVHGANVFVMPGVPREMKAMFHQAVLPVLEPDDEARGVILTTKINTFGLGESDVAQRLGDLMDRNRNPKVGTTVSDGLCSVRIRSEFANEAAAQQELEATASQVEQCMGPVAFGRDDYTLGQALLDVLARERRTLATAESCTGGLLGQMITDVPGSSRWYRGGWVVYSNEMKVGCLGVDEALIAAYGAVSEQVARALAAGALSRSGADVAVSITGIAGPDGGTADKPVGTIWLGLAWREGAEPATVAMQLSLGADRAANRDRAAKCAAQLVRLHLMGVPLDSIHWGRLSQDAAVRS